MHFFDGQKVGLVQADCGKSYQRSVRSRRTLHFRVRGLQHRRADLLQPQTAPQTGRGHLQGELKVRKRQRLRLLQVARLRHKRHSQAEEDERLYRRVQKGREEPAGSGLAGAHRGHLEETRNDRRGL